MDKESPHVNGASEFVAHLLSHVDLYFMLNKYLVRANPFSHFKGGENRV